MWMPDGSSGCSRRARRREALRLWRGAPLADVAGEPFAAPEIRRLQELHTAALEVAIDQDLDAGRHREALPEIDGLLAAEPLREPLHARRMLALYRCGRQADALEAYREARRTLIEQIGVEPGPELQRLHEAILRQDPALDPPVDGSRRTPLFGRERELERLRSVWRRVRDGGSASALISGEPGIGKTRLDAGLGRGRPPRGRRGLLGRHPGAHAGAPDPARARRRGHAAGGRRAGAGRDDERRSRTGSWPTSASRWDRWSPTMPRELARFDAGDDGPIERIVSASRGVPGLIRQAARDWARAQAMARVADAAARTSAERVQWQLAEGDLTTSVVEFQGIREPAASAPGACPYKGLEAFDVEDAAVFFGRERLVAEMVARLPGAPLLGIVGPSGSGKSSAMRAGLVAAIGARRAAGQRDLGARRDPPGRAPRRSRRPPRARAVLAVDQFEELFTVCRDERERAAFVAALLDRARRDTIVLVAVRADFYGECARYPELSRLLGANHVLVGPMRRHELRRAVELPARQRRRRDRARARRRPGRRRRARAGCAPAALDRAVRALGRRADAGGVRAHGRRTRGGGAPGRGRLRAARRRRPRRGAPHPAAARRRRRRRARASRSESWATARSCPPSPAIASSRSAKARPRSPTRRCCASGRACGAGWRRTPRDGGCIGTSPTPRGTGTGRTRASSTAGARLAAALEWADAHGAGPQRPRAELSHRRPRRERARAAPPAARARRRGHAPGARGRSPASSRSTSGATPARRRWPPMRSALGAQALTAGDLDRELLLARQGVALDDSLQTRGNLLAALLKSPAAIGVLRGDGDGLISLDLSPDERTLAFIDIDGTVTFLDRRTGRPAGPPATVAGQEPCIIVAQVRLDHLRFSPDGSRLAVGGCRPVILDARTHRVLARLRRPQRIHLRAALLARRAHAVRRRRAPAEGRHGTRALRRAQRPSRSARSGTPATVSGRSCSRVTAGAS